MSKSKIYNKIFVIVITIFSIILWFMPTGFENPTLTESTERERAEIIEVINNEVQTFNIVKVGSQYLKMKILSGKFKGKIIESTNVLMGQMRTDNFYKEGDIVIAVLNISKDGKKLNSARPDNIYRFRIEMILFGLFALFLVGFAGWTGFKALISFVFTALTIWKILIPLILKGYEPILVSFIVVSVATTVIILLISGFTKKGMVALSGSVGGVALTTAMALLFGYYFQIPGVVMEFSETILYAGFTDLNLNHIFIAGIFIAASGAVMDVAMDISAAQNEIVEKKPDISPKELIKSGFNVSYPVIGTMTTTLLFAYSSSYLFLFMVFMAKGTPWELIFNINFIAAEILHTLVGSFGLVLVAPITAILGGIIYTKK